MEKIRQVVGRVRGFFDETRAELKKCAWPVRSELFDSTVVVIISVVLITLFVGVCDFALMHILRLVIR